MTISPDPKGLRIAPWVALGAVLAPAIVLAWSGRIGPILGPVIVLSGGGIAALAGWAMPTRRGNWPTVAMIATLTIAVAFAPMSWASAALAGASGLAFLYWVSAADPSPKGGSELVGALLVSGGAVSVAVVSALLLPAPSADIGLAAVLVVGMLVWMAWLYRGPATAVEETPSGY